MSTLVDWQIKECIKKGEIKITPWDESLVNPNSLDFRLGDTIYFLNQDGERPYVDGIDPKDKATFYYFPYSLKEGFTYLKPHEFCIAPMLEHITLAPDIMANVRGKSSLGRLGLGNSHQAGLVDGGWEGVLTIELYNYSNYPIKLETGMKIGQITFERTEVPEKHYGETGRYQNQKAGMGSIGI